MEKFTVYPAIDLRLGQVVRLTQGDPSRQTVYGDDPAATARRWLEAGARWLHIVNLDGAFGEPDQANRRALQAILEEIRQTAPACRVQFGGGLRSLESALQALDAGVSRVVLGTAAVQSPELVLQLLERCNPDRLAVGLDAREGKVMLHGWRQASPRNALDLAAELAQLGLRTVIFTDILRDGMGAGINLRAAQALAQISGLEVIASGGVGSLADLQKARQSGLAGVIVGRALYDGSLRIEDALAMEKG